MISRERGRRSQIRSDGNGRTGSPAPFLQSLASPRVARWLVVGGIWLAASPPATARAEEPELERNFTMKTLGGRQFWGDVLYFHDWRIQRNVLTGHYRLLDGGDYRHASGSLQECRDRLDEIRRAENLPPMSGKAVILVHGIIRSSKSFPKLRARLKEEGYYVFPFSYPSTRVEIPEAAAYLHSVIESLEGIEEINFVVHSMGGLLVRAYLAEHRDERIGRMVMMGVPNCGADLADRLKRNFLYRAVFGPAGQQLVSDDDGLIARLPTPDFEFAVIAGARGKSSGYNPLIPGDDDGTVSVTCTQLPGAADSSTVKCLHAFLMGHEEAIDQAARFLETGRLRKQGPPQPIAPAEQTDLEEAADTEPAHNR